MTSPRINVFRSIALLLIVSLFIQIPLGQNVDDKTHINVYHLLLLIIPFLYFPSLKYFKFNAVFVFITVITITSVFVAPFYGAGLRSTLIIFVVMSFFMGNLYGRRLNELDLVKIFSIVFVCCVLFVILRDIAFAGQLSAIYTRTGYAPNMLYISTGGRNIEASLLAMLSILLIGTRSYIPSMLLALLTSGMMQSRAGLIGTAISIWIYLWRAKKTRFYYLLLVLGAVLLMVVAGLLLTSVVDIPLFDRFNLKSEEELAQNDVGRLALWHYASIALHKNLLGYGIGNGVPVMERLSGLHFVENNVHDVFLQFLLEGGVQSLVAYLVMIGTTLAKKVETPMQRNVKAFLLCYLVLSLIQFNGYEAYLWFFIGMFMAFPRQVDSKITPQSSVQFSVPLTGATLPRPAQRSVP